MVQGRNVDSGRAGVHLVHREGVKELMGDVHRWRVVCNCLQAPVPPHLSGQQNCIKDMFTLAW